MSESDSFKYICPYCSQLVEVPKSLEGIEGFCPSCNKEIIPRASMEKPVFKAVNTSCRKHKRKTYRPKKGWKRIFLSTFFSVLIFLLFLWLALSNSPKTRSSSPSSSKISSTIPKTLEYKLATINARKLVDKDDITINRFRTLLDLLSAKYVEDRQQIGDASVKVQQLLRKYGVSESLLNIMEGMNAISLGKLVNQKYVEYANSYLQLRKKGKSHQESIESINAIVQAYSND